MKMRVSAILVAFALLLGATQSHAADWNIDKSHTAIKFKVKHILTNVWGEFTEYDAQIHYDTANPSKSSVKVTIDVASIDTGNEKRDGHLRSADFFDAANHPTITFESTSFTPAGKGKYHLTGDLTIRGVTHEITLNVDGPSDPINFMGTTKIAASAQGEINRTEYGLNWNRALETGGLLVGEDVTMVIDVELDKAE